MDARGLTTTSTRASGQGAIAQIVDQRDRTLTPCALGEQRCENIDLIVIGDGGNGFGSLDIGFLEDVPIERVTMDDDRVAQLISNQFGARLVRLDHANPDVGVLLFQLLGEKQADIAAAHDNHPARFLLLMAKGHHGSAHVAGIDDKINLVATQHLIISGRDHDLVLPDDAHHADMEVREELRELAQGRIDDRTILPT